MKLCGRSLVALVLALAALAAVSASASAATNRIFTVAGSGVAGFAGDGGQATAAQLRYPNNVAVMADGSFLIVDNQNHRIRRVSPVGTIMTVAGTGAPGLSGDGGPAASAHINNPFDVAPTADGGFLIADTGNHRIRRVSPAGTITTVAGTTSGFAGDNGPATAAKLSAHSVAPTADGGFLIADAAHNRIRRVSPAGTITTVAGTGTAGFGGDHGPATAAQLDRPDEVAATAGGGFLIADSFNDRIRRVSPAGTITTAAGNGSHSFAGDNGPATTAALSLPVGLDVTSDGGFLIADFYNGRIRRVSAAGTITTVAGNGSHGFSGDGGPATSAQLFSMEGVAAAPGGGFLIADTRNARVRFVEGDPRPVPPDLLHPLPPPRGRTSDGIRPDLSGLSLSPRRFRAAGKGASVAARVGAKVSYRLSEAAVISFGVQRAGAGRRARGRCVKPTRANRRARRCTRYKALRGAFTHFGKAGKNSFAFTGRIAGRKLKPGRYRLRAVATDFARNRSRANHSRFRVVRR